MADLNVTLPASLKSWVDARVGEGGYASASDYVRELIERDQGDADESAWLQAMIDEGRASPVIPRDARDVLREVIEESRARRG